MRPMFLYDWSLARRSHGLEWFLVRCHYEVSTWRSLDRSKDAKYEEVERVTNVLWKYHRLIYGAFDHYSTIYSEKAAEKGETTQDRAKEEDVFHISFNAFIVFCRDGQLASESCTNGQLETLFKLVDEEKTTVNTGGFDPFGRQGSLSRKEWLELLVRIAVQKHVKSDSRGNPYGDVSDALERLMNGLMQSVPEACLQNSNAFRKKCCYLEQIDATFRRHMHTVKSLYYAYAECHPIKLGFKLADDELISIGEWLEFVKQLGLLDNKQITQLNAKHVFMWSRIRSLPDGTERSTIRLRHLFLEDFMEALVRLSTMLSLPTDDDVEAMGCADAGEFLLRLEASSPSSFSRFLESHAQLGTSLRQPVWRCLEHLLCYCERTLERHAGLTRDNEAKAAAVKYPPPQIDNDLARTFFKYQDRSPMGRLEYVSQLTGVVIGAASAMADAEMAALLDAVRERLLVALRGIEVFQNLTSTQLETLFNAMSQARYQEGEYVFRQGEDGASFYCVIGGTAEVVRTGPMTAAPAAAPADVPAAEAPAALEEEGRRERKILATLEDGACFGERALLKSEPRFASVIATGEEGLQVLYIDREQFEAVMGGPLASFVPDEY